MPDATNGPDQYWSTELPASRGQYRTLALLGLQLLGVPEPASRYDASVAITRLRAALDNPDVGRQAVPDVDPFA